jgi:hypothetical protein
MDADKNILIFAANYLEIPYVLFFVDKADFKNKVSICVTKNDLYQFYKTINNSFWQNKVDLIHYEILCADQQLVRNKILNYLSYLYLTKRLLGKIFREHFNDIKGYKIYFFCRGAVPSFMYLLNKLKYKNELIFMEHLNDKGESVIPYYKNSFSIKKIVLYLLDKIVYGLNVQLSTNGVWVFSFLSDSFLKKFVFQELGAENYQQEIVACKQKYIEQFVDIVSSEMVFFEQDLSYYLELTKQDEFYNNITKSFQNVFGDNFAIKLHPGQKKTLLPNTRNKQILPTYLPGEYLINPNIRYLISFFSAVIMQKDSTQMAEGVTRIMLLDLIPFENADVKQKIKQNITKMIEGRILFPKSWEELEKELEK